MIDKIQINLLKKIKKYFLKFEDREYKPKYNSIFYLASYSNFIGSYILKKLGNCNKNNFILNLNIILKDFLFSINYLNYFLYFKKLQKTFDRLIITWAYKENFDKQGSLTDRYFNKNSDLEKNTLWFVIYMSDEIPKNIGKNLILLCKRQKLNLNIHKIFYFFIKNIKFLFADINYFLSSISNYSFFSNILINELKPFLNIKIKHVLMPYEAQPFQNNIIAFLKKKYSGIKTVGYVHSPPLALPSNFIYKKFSPDKLVLNGSDQVFCFTKLLGWNKSKVKLLPSFRFLKNKLKIKKTIYLPFLIRDRRIILKSLIYLNKRNYIDIKTYEVKNHPSARDSKQNLFLIDDIKKLKINTKQYEFTRNNQGYLIFIGNSGGIIEALERGSKVIQIVEFPLFDIYSNKIWRSIIRKKINNNIYIYSLKKKGNLIKFGNREKIKLESYCI